MKGIYKGLQLIVLTNKHEWDLCCNNGIVVMDFDCYIGNCSSIPTQDDSLGIK